MKSCTICKHPNLGEINAAIVSGTTYRDIAGRFGTSKSALERHKSHVSAALMKAKAAAEIVQGDSLIEKITQLEREARRLGRKAEDAGDLRAAMAAVRDLVRIVELLAKIQGDIKDPGGTTVNVVYVNAAGLNKSNGPIKRPAETDESSAASAIVDLNSSR